MKEVVGNKSNNSNGRRTAAEKEKTKMRERERRAITTKIFQGLRQHGGYRLSPRSDINEVLRHLAVEAGWIIEPDGTTYRSSSSTGNKSCQHCGVGGKHGKATPTSSIVGPPNGGAGECSTTTSPLRATLNDGAMNTPTTLYSNCTTSALLSSSSQDTLLAVYMYGDGGGAGGGAAVIHQSFESEHAGWVTSGDSI